MYATIHFLALSRKHALHDYRPETRSLFATGGGGADVSDLMQTSKQLKKWLEESRTGHPQPHHTSLARQFFTRCDNPASV